MKTISSQFHRFVTHEEMQRALEDTINAGGRIVSRGDVWFVSEGKTR